jgi:hypothetical protein
MSVPAMRWSPERVTVVLIAIGWLLLCSPIPSTLHGTGAIVVLALIALDVVLGLKTHWLAFSPRRRLDERQAAVRDDAYRTAFHWMRAAIIVMLILASIGAGLASIEGGPGPAGASLRFLVAFLELIVILPSAVIAWQGDVASHSPEASSHPVRRWSALIVIPVLALGWFAVASVLPTRTVVATPVPGSLLFSMEGASCQHYAVEKEIAAGFGGTLGVRAEVCWNGRQAFVVGDPSLPLPQGILPHQEVLPAGPAIPSITSCSAGRSESDFGVASQTCTEHIDADGTMTLTARGRVSPLPFELGARDLEVQLTVDRDGKVISVR